MNRTLASGASGGARRVFVAIVVASAAAAAVAAGVALNGHHAPQLAARSDAGAMPPSAVPARDSSVPAASVVDGVPATTGEPAPTF